MSSTKSHRLVVGNTKYGAEKTAITIYSSINLFECLYIILIFDTLVLSLIAEYVLMNILRKIVHASVLINI